MASKGKFKVGDRVLVEAVVIRTFGDRFPVLEIPSTQTPVCVDEKLLRPLTKREQKGGE